MIPPAWRRLEPVLLLFAAGIGVGLIFPLGKLAADVGLPPLVFAGASAAGASLVLAVIAIAAGSPPRLTGANLRYAAVAGQITFAIPFGMVAVVIPHLGSGIPSILQSLTPILTLAIVYTIGFEKPEPLRALGLATGLAGALVILVSRNAGALAVDAGIGWYLAALVTPLTLATGNVFRSTHWPKGEGPLPLATLTLAAATAGIVLILVVLGLAGQPVAIVAPLAAGWHIVLFQSLATGIGYAFFFRLQQVGGPVYLSQISYVNTAVGLGFAVLFFGETLTVWIWFAVALVFIGVGLVNRTFRWR